MKLASNTSSSFLSECREDDQVDFTDYSDPFLSGHGFSLRCHWFYSKNLPKLGVNPSRDNRCVYVKTDHLPDFFKSSLVPDKFVLVTHNSDYVIGEAHLPYMNDPRLEMWLALNKGVDHKKVKSIPDGLQNPCYGYGNARLLNEMSLALGDSLPAFSHYKKQMFHACYTIDSKFTDRAKCAAVCQPQGIDLLGRRPYINYLAEVSETMFTLCPNGGGIDSCRPWESIYLKAIPIVTKHWTMFEHHRNFGMPMVLLDAWSETYFKRKNFSHEVYEKLWGTYDPAELHMNEYCAKVRDLYGVNL